MLLHFKISIFLFKKKLFFNSDGIKNIGGKMFLSFHSCLLMVIFCVKTLCLISGKAWLLPGLMVPKMPQLNRMSTKSEAHFQRFRLSLLILQRLENKLVMVVWFGFKLEPIGVRRVRGGEGKRMPLFSSSGHQSAKNGTSSDQKKSRISL